MNSRSFVGGVRSPLGVRNTRPGVPALRRARAATRSADGPGNGGNCGNGGDRRWGSDGPEENGGGNKWAWLLGASAIPMALDCRCASADEVSTTVDQLWDTFGPFVTQLGFSGLVGLACAGALKMIGKSVALAIGLLFALLQVMQYAGFIEVNWKTVQAKLGKRFDVTGDSKFDSQDVKQIMDSGLRVLSDGVPSIGGFLAGFVLGVKIL